MLCEGKKQTNNGQKGVKSVSHDAKNNKKGRSGGGAGGGGQSESDKRDMHFRQIHVFSFTFKKNLVTKEKMFF